MKDFYVYRQEFKFKVSYMILGNFDYTPKGATKLGTCHARNKADAALWMKEHLSHVMSNLVK